MPEKKKAIVKIAGVDYTLVSDESLEYIQKIGIYVDRKIREVLEHNRRLSTGMASLLASVNIADDYLKTQKTQEHLQKELDKTTAEYNCIKMEYEQTKQTVEDLKRQVQKLQIDLANKNGRLSK